MNTELKKLPKSRVELTIEVPTEMMAGFFDSAYHELGHQVDIAGFRKGKAPKPMILDRVGRERIIAAAIDHALPQTYRDALLKHELVPVGEPNIHIKDAELDGALNYKVEVDVLPDVETGDYRRVKVNAKKYAAKQVDAKDVDEALGRIRRAAATPKPVDRPAQKGDWVEMSYTGKVNGVVQSNLQSKHHPLVLGDGSILPEFDKELEGMKKDESKTFTMNLPLPDGNSQPVSFDVTVVQVAELELPELNDELAKRFGKGSLDNMRAAIEEESQADLDREARLALETAVVEEVVKKAKVEVPEGLVEREIEHRLEEMGEQLARGGQSLESFVASQKKDMDTFRKDMRPAAEQAVKTGLVLRAIADNEEFVKPAENATPEVLKKVVDFLVENATK